MVGVEAVEALFDETAAEFCEGIGGGGGVEESGEGWVGELEGEILDAAFELLAVEVAELFVEDAEAGGAVVEDAGVEDRLAEHIEGEFREARVCFVEVVGAEAGEEGEFAAVAAFDEIDEVVRVGVFAEFCGEEVFVEVGVADFVDICVEVEVAFVRAWEVDAVLEVDAVAVGVDGPALDSGEGVIARWV